MKKFSEKTAIRVCDKIMKNAIDSKSFIGSHPIHGDYGMLICDDFRAVLIPSFHDLYPVQDTSDSPLYDSITKNFFSVEAKEHFSEFIDLPPLAWLKEWRKYKGRSKPYDLGYGLPAVNVTYLIDMLELFPDAIVTVAPGEITSQIYFDSVDGCGFIMPVYNDQKRAEREAIKKAQ